MKIRISVLLAALALGACDTMGGVAATKSSAQQLATQDDMRAVIGRTLVYGPGRSIVIAGDGTFSGDWEGNPLSGTYEMRDGFFCRVLDDPQGNTPKEDCQLFVLDGDQLHGTRDRGNGNSFTYTVGGQA